jgi:hypothetical protein
VIRVRPEQRPSSLSWRFLAGLEVEIAVDGEDIPRAVALVDAIDRAQPLYLGVWNMGNDALMRVRFYGARMVCPETIE